MLSVLRSALTCIHHQKKPRASHLLRSRLRVTCSSGTPAAAASSSSPYTPEYVRSLFSAHPRNLTRAAVIAAFESAPTPNAFLVSVAGGCVRTIAPRSSRLDCTRVKSRPNIRWKCGYDTWQRYKRFEYYLFAAAQRDPSLDALFVVDMDEVADHDLGVPKFGTGASACGRSIPVPFPLKGFGTVDLAEKMRHTMASGAWRRGLTPWAQRTRVALWRGCSRRFPPSPESRRRAAQFHAPPARAARRGLAPPPEARRRVLHRARRSHPGGGGGGARRARSAAGFAALSSRYLIAADGHGWQASLAAKLMLGSAVISHASYYPTWFQPLLFFGEHLLLVDAQWRGLPAAVRWLRGDDATARRIARQGEARIEELLREEHLVGYVRDLLREYQRLMVREEGAPSADAALPPLLRRRRAHFAATRGRAGRRSLTIGLGRFSYSLRFSAASPG